MTQCPILFEHRARSVSIDCKPPTSAASNIVSVNRRVSSLASCPIKAPTTIAILPMLFHSPCPNAIGKQCVRRFHAHQPSLVPSPFHNPAGTAAPRFPSSVGFSFQVLLTCCSPLSLLQLPLLCNHKDLAETTNATKPCVSTRRGDSTSTI